MARTAVMGSANGTKIRPLKNSVVLYIDNSPMSRKAKEVLSQAGISASITNGRVEPFQRKPLVLYCGGTYQGLKEIHGLVNLLKFWSEHSAESKFFVSPYQADALRK
jgi:hypothetical protein